MSTSAEPRPKTYDFVGIGIGPFNLGLACLTEPIAELDGLFLEAKPAFKWHGGMLLEGTHLQTPFMSDLVTLADPTSPYSFLNYLKEKGSLYSFYIRENFFPLRVEYDAYCRWAANRLSNVRFGTTVVDVTYEDEVYVVRTDSGARYLARRLILGTGTVPFVPSVCDGLSGDFLHSSEYAQRKAELQSRRSVTIVGSGQSAAEIYYQMLAEADVHGYQLNWVTRSPRFFPLEYTKLTLEMTSPEYIDYFHALPEATRYGLEAQQKPLFKGISSDLINSIFDLLYQKKVGSGGRAVATRLLTNSSLVSARYRDGSYTLGFHQAEQDKDFEIRTEGLVLATGYHYEPPAFLDSVRDRLRFDSRGRFQIARNYTIDVTGQGVFLQNGGVHAHSLTSPDLGMGAYRNSCIIRELLGAEHYPVEKTIAFQEFGV